MSTVTAARRELMRLNVERLDALHADSAAHRDYLRDLDAAIAECQVTDELLALTEIASLRAGCSDADWLTPDVLRGCCETVGALHDPGHLHA